MTVLLSPVGGAAAQFFDNNGTPLTGGKLYSYVAGTTTPQATYTSASGATAHTNPVILDSGGRVPGGEIWLTDGLQYKFVLRTSTDVLIGTYDNLVGVNSNFVNFLTDTEVQTATAGQTVFTLTTMQYQPGTNNLTVYVDGVNQIDGVSYSYVETNATTVTFTAGLHVGALVKFTTAQTLSTGVTDASLVTYDPPFTASVVTTVEDKLAQTVSVKDFGAVGDGVADDTTAVTNACAAVSTGGRVLFPSGVYLMSPTIISNLTNVTLEGDNKNTSILRLASTGTLLSLSNAQWCLVTRLGFDTNAAPQTIANATGLRFDTGAGNNTVDDCNFLGFSQGGVKIVGTAGTTLSGHKVTNCYFLGNGQYQFQGVYCNDFHIENNQFGRLAGISLATIGCYLENSSAGTYIGNYHWDNVNAFTAFNCNYNTYTENRFEESSQQNVVINSGSYNIFSLNKCHTASKGSSGVYDNVYILGVASLSVIGNSLFSFDATNSAWGINIAAGCSSITLGKNQISSFSPSYGPIGVVSSVGAISADFELHGLTSGTSGAGQTTYVGAQLNTFSEGQATFNVSRRCTLLRIYAAVDVAPGAGQSFIYVPRKNAVDTAMAASISGAGSFSASANASVPAVLFAPDDGVSMELTTSGSAAAANHRWYMVFAEY